MLHYLFFGTQDIDFFQHLEMHLRAEQPSLCGRDHISYRSYYLPVKVRYLAVACRNLSRFFLVFLVFFFLFFLPRRKAQNTSVFVAFNSPVELTSFLFSIVSLHRLKRCYLLIDREVTVLRRLLQRKRHARIGVCVTSSVLRLFRVGHVVQSRRFLLHGTNGFHVIAKDERFTAAGPRCRQNLKYENFTPCTCKTVSQLLSCLCGHVNTEKVLSIIFAIFFLFEERD